MITEWLDPVSYKLGQAAGGGGGGSSVTNAMGTKITDIPDLSVLDRTDPVIYFVVDTAKYTLPLYSRFSIRPIGTGTLTMSVGHIASTGYVEDDSETVSSGDYYVKDLSDNGHRFWVFRLTSSGGTVTRCDLPTSAYVPKGQLIPVVALVGNFTGMTQFRLQMWNVLILDLTNVSDSEAMGIGSVENDSLVSVKLSGAFAMAVNAWYNIKTLQSVDLSGVDFSSSTTFAQPFYNCSSLRSVNLGTQDLSAADSIQNIFAGCMRLQTLDLAGVDFSGVTNAQYAFKGCEALSVITGWTNIPVSYSLSTSPGLTHDSLMVVINALPEVQTAQTLTLGIENTAKLTAEEIAVATGKGWTVA